MEARETVNLLSDNAWFELHPEKLLGTEKIASTRWSDRTACLLVGSLADALANLPKHQGPTVWDLNKETQGRNSNDMTESWKTSHSSDPAELIKSGFEGAIFGGKAKSYKAHLPMQDGVYRVSKILDIDDKGWYVRDQSISYHLWRIIGDYVVPKIDHKSDDMLEELIYNYISQFEDEVLFPNVFDSPSFDDEKTELKKLIARELVGLGRYVAENPFGSKDALIDPLQEEHIYFMLNDLNTKTDFSQDDAREVKDYCYWFSTLLRDFFASPLINNLIKEDRGEVWDYLKDLFFQGFYALSSKTDKKRSELSTVRALFPYMKEIYLRQDWSLVRFGRTKVGGAIRSFNWGYIKRLLAGKQLIDSNLVKLFDRMASKVEGVPVDQKIQPIKTELTPEGNRIVVVEPDFGSETSVPKGDEPPVRVDSESIVVALANENKKGKPKKKVATKKEKLEKGMVAAAALLVPAEIKEGLVSFEESVRELNKGISDDEIACYLYYKKQLGEPWKGLWEGSKWDKLADQIAYDTAYRDKLIDSNLLAFNGKLYEPMFLFVSGMATERYEYYMSQADNIIARHGDKNFAKWKGFLDANKPTLLRIDENPDESENALVLDIGLKEITDKRLIFSDESRIAYQQDNGDKLKAPKFDLSLIDGFKSYLSTIDFGNNLSYSSIVDYYVNGKQVTKGKNDSPEEVMRKTEIKRRSIELGVQAWGKFLTLVLTPVEKASVEKAFADVFNRYINIDFNKVPIALRYAKQIKPGIDTDFRAEKREAVAFIANEGSGIHAFDVGVGKTWAAIFTIEENLTKDYCKRPLIIAPTSVAKQFAQEIKQLLPHRKVHEYGNMGTEFKDKILDENGVPRKIEEGAITVVTIEALEVLGLGRYATSEFVDRMRKILNQGTERDRRGNEQTSERIETMVGEISKNNLYAMDDFGFDFAVVDEAHSLKNLFTQIKGEADDEDGTRDKNRYMYPGKAPSKRAIKGFLLLSYIQSKNRGGNVVLLTATPFTNAPTEVFSMLALVAFEKMSNQYALDNAHRFFSLFAEVSYELGLKAGNQFETLEVVKGFKNLSVLNKLIRRFILFKDGEDVGMVRPTKIVLPLNGEPKLRPEDKALASVAKDIKTLLYPTVLQTKMFDILDEFIAGKGDLCDLCSELDEAMGITGNPNSPATECTLVPEGEDYNDPKLRGVRTLKGISINKKVNLSPYILAVDEDCSNAPAVSYTTFVEASPKILYAIECIRTAKEHHKNSGTPMTGHIIYMSYGVEYFDLIKAYLVEKVGFGQKEVQFVVGGMKAENREAVKNGFNSGHIHVIIGSSAMKEGMNLQKRGVCIYNLTLDWNPTDIKQLEGRIHRQGNNYAYVRIVNPLLANSSDSFVMQKLDEKTSRINMLTKTGTGKSALKIDELNPEELKFEIITNSSLRARAEIEEYETKLNSNLIFIGGAIQKTENDIVKLGEVHLGYEKARRWANAMGYLPKEGEENYEKIADPIWLLALVRRRFGYMSEKISQTFGQPVTEQYLLRISPDADNWSQKLAEIQQYIALVKGAQLPRMETGTYSSIDTPFYHLLREERALKSLINVANGLARNYSKDVLALPTVDFLRNRLATQQLSLSEANNEKALFNVEERIEKRTAELDELKRKKMAETGLPADQAKEFAKLNWMLDKTVLPQADLPVAKVEKPLSPEQCPPMAADGKPRVDEEALTQLERCIKSLTPTKVLNQVNGKYTAQRLKLHEKIYKEVLDVRPCNAKQPIAVFTGGLPGAGKSTFIRKAGYDWMLNSHLVFHIDADDIRAKLPEYKGWNADQTHLETKDLVNELIGRIGKPCRHHLLYDGTMKTYRDYYPMIDVLKKMGYEVYVIFMLIDPEVAKQRAINRYRNGNDGFHRYVPLSIIDNNSNMGRQPMDMLKDKVDGYLLVDGQTQQILESGGKSIPTQVDIEDNANVESVQPKTTEPTAISKSLIKKRIGVLQKSVRFLADSPQKQSLVSRIKTLKNTLLYV